MRSSGGDRIAIFTQKSFKSGKAQIEAGETKFHKIPGQARVKAMGAKFKEILDQAQDDVAYVFPL